MDNMGDWRGNNLINELVQGWEATRHLQMCMSEPSTSQETREKLIQRIKSTFEKALAMLNWNGGSKHPTGLVFADTPPFSPRSEGYDRDLQDQDHNAPRKRKTMARWTKHIRVSLGMGVEAPLHDGFSWRKYGQKDILGAKFPRGYYRCTHRNVQGCLATKQVQRSNEDPTIFEITYRGSHTCALASNLPCSSMNPNQQQGHADPSNQTSVALFQFPSSSNAQPETHDLLCPMVENSSVEAFSSPSYLSLATSGTPHFSVSHQNLGASGSDIKDIISTTNTSSVGSEFPFDQLQVDAHTFTFDNAPLF